MDLPPSIWAFSLRRLPAVVLLLLSSPLFAGGLETLIPRGSEWSYEPVRPSPSPSNEVSAIANDDAWRGIGFDDEWKTGRAGSGLVTIDDAAMAAATEDRRFGFRLRHTFEVPAQQLDRLLGLRLETIRNDGVTVFLNGHEVYRLGSPHDDREPTFGREEARSNHYYRWYFSSEHLVSGTNVLAVETFRISARSQDPDFDLSLDASTGHVEIWRGPYLQMGSPKSATLRFATSIPAKPVLRYGKAPSELNQRQVGRTGTDHRFVVESLEPDTTYYYAVEIGGRPAIGFDLDHRFRTHPPTGAAVPIRIWVVGDSGRGQFSGADLVRDAYLKQAAGRSTEIWLMLGDNAYYSGATEEYQDAVFDEFRAFLPHTFLWPVIGNHDKRAFTDPSNGPYLELFDLPTRAESGGVASGSEHFYSFDYGNLHVIVLDSESSSLEPESPQVRWLRADLAANRAEWTLAAVHTPPYSRGGHDSDRAPRHYRVRKILVPLLEAGGVDLVLAGHSHGYERSHPIRGHYGTSYSWNPAVHRVAKTTDGVDDGAYDGRGTVYVVVGSSSHLSLEGSLDHPAMARAARSLGSLVVDIEADRLEARFLKASGEIGDRFAIRHPPPRP